MNVWRRLAKKTAGHRGTRQRRRERNMLARELAALQKACIEPLLKRSTP